MKKILFLTSIEIGSHQIKDKSVIILVLLICDHDRDHGHVYLNYHLLS